MSTLDRLEVIILIVEVRWSSHPFQHHTTHNTAEHQKHFLNRNYGVKRTYHFIQKTCWIYAGGAQVMCLMFKVGTLRYFTTERVDDIAFYPIMEV